MIHGYIHVSLKIVRRKKLGETLNIKLTGKRTKIIILYGGPHASGIKCLNVGLHGLS